MTVRNRLVWGTIDLIRRRGVAGSGINEIISHSQVARRTVYNNFPAGKNELVAEAVRVAGEVITATVRRLLDEAASPLDLPANFAATWKTSLSDTQFEAGCPIAAGALAGQVAPEARIEAAAAFASLTDLLESALCEAGLSAERARSLAITLVCAVEGAVILVVARNDLEPLDAVADQMTEMLRVNGIRESVPQN